MSFPAGALGIELVHGIFVPPTLNESSVILHTPAPAGVCGICGVPATLA